MDLKNRKSRINQTWRKYFILYQSANIVASLPRTFEDDMKQLWEKEEI